jgi:NADPH:quinone reductase
MQGPRRIQDAGTRDNEIRDNEIRDNGIQDSGIRDNGIQERSRMKAWWLCNSAQGSTLELREVPMPEPAADELLVKVAASSLNRGEFISAVGLHKSGERPSGIDAAGVVERVGAQVRGFAPGDRVMGRAIGGGFAQYTRMNAGEAIPVPASLDWRQAAAFPITFTVTYDMLVAQGGLRAGDWLLVTGVSSGVGVACLQLGKALGAHVIGTSGSQAKIDQLRGLGLDQGIVTRSADFAEAVRQMSAGHGADVIVNNVGGSVLAECLRAAAFEARLAVVGYVDRVMESPLDIGLLHEQRLKIYGVSNKLRTAAQRSATVQGLIRDVLPLLASGRIRPLIARTYDFAALPEARAFMQSDAQVGKIVLDHGSGA